MPIPIFLDTSLIRSLSPRAIVAKSLFRLVSLGAVKVHVSVIVEREAATGLASEAKIKFNSEWASDSLRPDLAAAAKTLADAGTAIEKGVSEWLDKLSVVRHHPTSDETVRVFNAYFLGSPPFKSLKNRNDIPDAFILESIRSFASTSPEKVLFVAKDATLAAGAKRIENVEVSDDLARTLAHIDVARPISRSEIRDLCQKDIANLHAVIEGNLGAALDGYEIIDSNLPSDRGVATVTRHGLPETESIDFDWADSELLGPESITLYFHCRVPNCLLDMRVHKAKHQAIGKDKLKLFSIVNPDLDVDYMQVQSMVTIHVEARLFVEVKAHADMGEAQRRLMISGVELILDDVGIDEV